MCGFRLPRALVTAAGVLFFAGVLHGQISVHDLAARVDEHYNHLNSFRANFREQYDGLGMHRDETGTLLLKKPGRMRWTYGGGKLFLLDGKSAISYAPGDAQAQRIPAKQLDDLRSPLRFLLGHMRLEKELDHLALAVNGGVATLTGSPRYVTGPQDQRIRSIALTVAPSSGTITGLRVEEIDGSSTAFTFDDVQENVPATDADFRFFPAAGVTVVDGLAPM